MRVNEKRDSLDHFLTMDFKSCYTTRGCVKFIHNNLLNFQ